MSKRKFWAVIAVAVLHAFLAYALISGLAIKAVQVITGPMESVNIEEPAPPPEEAPPPPPKLEDIPPYVPPPDVQIETTAPPPPTITTQTVVPQPAPIVAPPAPPAPPPPPPAPKGPTTRAEPNMRTLSVSSDDYPPASQRAEEEGTTRIEVVVGTNGRVTNCQVIQSSGHSRLDEAACRMATRRWRYKPAQMDGTPVESRDQKNVVWRLENVR